VSRRAPPRPVVFARVGWLDHYDSVKDGERPPIGGGSFNTDHRGSGVENFHAIRSRVYGYVKTGAHNSGINLARLDARGYDEVEGVLVIFVAPHPTPGAGQRIVGWYDDATCLAEAGERSDHEDGCEGYFNIVAPARTARVLHPHERENHPPIPKGKGALGQSNICYAEYPQQRGAPGRWIDEAVEYVLRYRPPGRSDPTRPALLAYEPVSERVSTRQPLPFTKDPDLLDKALKVHRTIQNQLARLARRHGRPPQAPGFAWPRFDLGWHEGAGFTVVEVKSLSDGNEEHQIRYGIGQLLDYRAQLRSEFARVRSVLAVAREPSDLRWVRVCRDAGIVLVWPATFHTLFAARRGR
jgi:hypothetical protein